MTEATPTAKMLLDAGSSGENGAHATETALRCLRLYSLGHRGKAHAEEAASADDAGSAPESDQLVRGSVLHVGLAHWYLARGIRAEGGSEATIRENIYSPEAAMEIVAAKKGRIGAKWLEACKVGLAAYATRYAKETSRVLCVEELLRAEVPYVYRGETYNLPWTQRLDLGLEESDGIWFVDHKVVGRITPEITDRYVLSLQMIGYRYLGAKLYGKDFRGVKVNYVEVRKPDVTVGEIKFSREVVPPAPDSQKSFAATVFEARRRVAFWDEVDGTGVTWPKANSEMACVTKYGACPHFSRCQWGGG